MSMARMVCMVAGIVGLGMTLGAARAGMQSQAVPQIKEVPCEAIVSIEGKDNYAAYCAACHGADGKGMGPAAPALKGPVPDLTSIAKRQGGKFNAIAIERALMGADKVPPAHGTKAMPIWGPLFRGAEWDKHVTTLRLMNLVKYLESIQTM